MAPLVTVRDLAQQLSKNGDAPALITLDRDGIDEKSFSTVTNDVEMLASGLIAADIKKGTPVGIYADSGPDWIIAFLAIVTAGGIAVPFDTSLKGAALAQQMRDSGCRFFFVAAQQAKDLREIDAVELDAVYLLGDKPSDGTSEIMSRHALATSAVVPLPNIEARDLAAFFYTSGTTGTPKGVPLTHANLVANINALVAEHMVGSDDRILLPMPLHHVYPLVVGALASLASGAGLVFPAGISGPQIVDALHRGDASVLIGVPRLYSALFEAVDARIRGRSRTTKAVIRGLFSLLDMASDSARRAIGNLVFRRVRTAIGPRLRLLASGGAHLDAELWRALERFGWTVLTGYGLTETAPILTFNPLTRSKIGSAGKALLNVELRISAADAEGVGEIEARGPSVFAGYRDRPEETAAAFTPDGWFRTGDLGRLDDDGYLFVVGRSKELIVLPDGKNVFPETIEAVYGSSPLISEIAVLEENGKLVGLVVPDLDGLRTRGAESAVQLVHDEIRDLSPSLPPHERLSGHVLTRLTLPRTAIGKLKRHQLNDLYQGARSGAVGLVSETSAEDRVFLSQPRADEIWDWIRQRFPDRPLSLDVSPQLDLGVDSLGWTGLSLEIGDRFGVDLSEEQISRIVTLRDLISEVINAAATPIFPGKLSPTEEKYLAPPGYMQRLLSTVSYGVFRLAMRSFFRLRVTGLENVPADGPFIIAPNHASWLDPIAIAASLSFSHIRQIRFAGWAGIMFGNIVARAFSWVAGVFPVNPDRASASSLALARAVLDQKRILVWFPEGRRTTTGNLLTFQPGIGVLLGGSTVPVIPAYITGTFEAAPAGHLIPKFRPINVHFGSPQTVADLTNNEHGEKTPQRIADALHDVVLSLEDRVPLNK